MGDACGDAAREMFAERKKKRCTKKEPGEDSEEGLRRSFDQENCTRKAPDDAGDDERDHDATRNVQLHAISAAAGRCTGPESESVGGVGGNRRNSREKQSWKCDETAPARDGVDGSSKGSGEKKEDGVVKSQTKVLSRVGVVAPVRLKRCPAMAYQDLLTGIGWTFSPSGKPTQMICPTSFPVNSNLQWSSSPSGSFQSKDIDLPETLMLRMERVFERVGSVTTSTLPLLFTL